MLNKQSQQNVVNNSEIERVTEMDKKSIMIEKLISIFLVTINVKQLTDLINM